MLHPRNDTPIMSKRMRQDAFSSDDEDDTPLLFKRPIVALANSGNPVSSHVMAQSKQDVNVQVKLAKGGPSSGANNHMFDDKKRIENCEIKDLVNRNKSQDNKIHPSMNAVTSGNTIESDLSKRASHLKKSGENFSSHGNSENGSMSRSITNVQSDKYSMATGTTGLAKKAGDRLLPGKNSHLKSAFDVKPEDSDDDDKPLSMRLQTARPVESTTVAKVEVDSDDDKPLSYRFAKSAPAKTLNKDSSCEDDDSDDDKPLLQRLNKNRLVNKDLNDKGTSVKSEFIPKKRPPQENNLSSTSATKKVKPSSHVKQESSDDSDDEDNVPIAQRMKKSSITSTPSTKLHSSAKLSTPANKAGLSTKKIDKNSKLKPQIRKVELTSSKNVKIERVPPGSGEGQKWTNLEHNGVIFPPPYKPHGVKMLYNGKSVDLTPDQEEVATMFAVMKDTDYATKSKFLENFWHDWKHILGPKHVIQKFELCDFTPIYEWHLREKDKKKLMTAEEKKALKEEKLKQEDRYKWAYVDGKKEQVGNFRVEPPALFRGRGEHPKMGKLKKRIFPEDITINIGRGAPIPECPMPGHRWKEIRHDNTVTWLAFWNDPINTKEFKYVFLAASSSLKGQSDKEKYEKARALKEKIDDIRSTYTRNFQSKDETRKQIAVATYLIDRLALRAGNEKDDDEADTVGCCTLKVENVALVESRSIQFDFLGKDSIRYFNTVEVDPRVYKAIGDFKKGKKPGDDLFDRIDTSKLNAHLKEIMPGLTAKVFRTYNASITLDQQLVCAKGNDVVEKLAAYQKANKEVAILCNHQRSVAKTHGTQMERLKGKIEEIEAQIKELETDLLRARKGKPPLKDSEGKQKKSFSPEKLEQKISQAKAKREKLKKDIELKDELKTVALGTSKINYMDPRITVAWCKRNEVPIEKVFNKSLLAKFAWAMDIEPDYEF